MKKILLILTLLISTVIAKDDYPYDLDIAAPIQTSGSDTASKNFNSNELPTVNNIVNKYTTEYTALDPGKFQWSPIKFAEPSSVRVYFINENAGYVNTLGYSTISGTPLDESAKLIFPNIRDLPLMVRNTAGPLKPGDFVDLGSFNAGQSLDFFLIANGFNGGTEFFSTKQSQNKDSIPHAIILGGGVGGVYDILSFEDMLGGGDRDYNDAIFAIVITPKSVVPNDHLCAPEPSLLIGCLVSLVGLGFVRKRD